MLHINIASSATALANVVLFKLLVLGHLSTPEGARYNSKTADSYFIELPVNISVLSGSNQKQRQSVDDKFYFTAQNQGLPRVVVTPENNPLVLSEMEQYVFKWLRAFKQGNLRGNEGDPDFDHTVAPEVDDQEWKELLLEYCPEADGSMILTTNFIKYMHSQLEQVEGNIFLQNAYKPREDINMKHMVVQSLILSSKDFSMRSYQRKAVDEEDENKFGKKKKTVKVAFCFCSTILLVGDEKNLSLEWGKGLKKNRKLSINSRRFLVPSCS